MMHTSRSDHRVAAPGHLLTTALGLCLGAACGGGTIGDTSGTPDAMSAADANPCQGLPLEEWYADTDNDGYGDPDSAVTACAPIQGYVQNGADCDDARGAVNPEAAEVCGDYLDNDCAGGDPCVDSMIAHWRFDETQGVVAVDATGHGHDGVLIDGPTWNGTGLVFDGVDDYVVAQHAPDLHIDRGSIALWFRTDNAQRTQGLWSKDHTGFGTGGHLSVYVNYNATDGTSAIIARIQDTAASYTVSKNDVQANTWYHVVVSFGADGFALRVNNQLAASNPYTGGLGTSSGGAGNTEPLAMGGHNWNSDPGMATPMTNPLVGTIHDVQIYDRALLASEIADLYEVYAP